MQITCIIRIPKPATLAEINRTVEWLEGIGRPKVNYRELLIAVEGIFVERDEEPDLTFKDGGDDCHAEQSYREGIYDGMAVAARLSEIERGLTSGGWERPVSVSLTA